MRDKFFHVYGWKALTHLVPLIPFAIPAAVQAEFSLNFMPETSRFEEPEWLNFNCNRPRAPGGDFEDCDDNDEFRDNNGRDRTAFLMERVRDPNSTDQYYHVIIGLPGDDFVQEAYIKITRNCDEDRGCRVGSIPREVDDLGPISDSLGNWRDITETRDNAYDPLGPAEFSGSGTANPNSTQFRQILDSDGVFQEITKASFNRKHKIVQNIDSGGVFHDFELDMTNSTFDQSNIAGVMSKNILRVTDGDFVSEFDINNMGDLVPPDAPPGQRKQNVDVNVTGGKYVYVNKYQTSMSGGPFESEYEGEGAGFNIWEQDWKVWYDPSQNVGHLYGCDDECNGGRADPFSGGSGWSSGWGGSRSN